MKTKLILLLCTVIFFGSCSKISEQQSSLKGSWTWVSTSGGLAGMTYTPESTGTTKQLKIDHRYLYYSENNILKLKTKYKVIISGSIYSKYNVEIIDAELSDIRQSFEINNDTLILREECFDCFIHLYIKSTKKRK